MKYEFFGFYDEDSSLFTSFMNFFWDF